jgi:hypothetical protein
MSCHNSSRPRSSGRSKIKITANCRGTLPLSIARYAKSAELAHLPQTQSTAETVGRLRA